ncbi:hypothetical protein JAAARDRAFT_146629 [Jaapia argillacea MUCL 33604]|uniref:Importin N-terminal domain-containing protein n=1 Tax=Jaapia argillacea MUCL 33604 TaxID=933084 RepID=A0A067QH58_9AGAM|nr:hypothetical protein JAAARDRAFT_146629 [Jaapia argillacea MUCL 33604]
MATSSEIAQCLAATLNSDPNIRISAELKIAELSKSPDAGLALSQIIVAQDVDMTLRQMSLLQALKRSSIVLRKYVTERWSPYFPAFKGSAPPVEIKAQIRQAVFQRLSDPNRKIRTLCAHTLSSIANCDWPDEYPDLLTSLINLLSSNVPDSVHGAMQVFTEFIKSDLTEDQILPVLRQLLPVLLSILGSTEHTPLTRSRTISVFRQCVTALFMVKDQHPQAVKEATASVLPVWLEAFKVLLNIDPQQDVSNGNWDGLSIRIQIFRTLDTIHTSFPRTLTPHLQAFLVSCLHHLHALFPSFSAYYISASASIPTSSEDEVIDFPQLACPILDFISAATRGGKAREWFDPSTGNLDNLIGSLIGWMQMTNEDEDDWATNANTFVAQEDDDTQSYSVRVAGFDLLASFMDRIPAQTASALNGIVQRVVSESRQAKEAGHENWWRPLEASLAAVGSQADSILECIEDEQDSGRAKPIQIESLLTDVVPSLLGLSDCPFLQGRGFVFASQFSKLLPAQLAGQYLEAAIHVIEAEEAGIPIKVSAVKAVNNFCQGMDDAVLAPVIARIARDIGPFALATSEDTLSLVLETLSVVIEVEEGKWLTPDLTSSLVMASLEVWSKNTKDPIFISVLTDIMSSLAAATAPGIYEIVLRQALPTLCTAIGSAKPEESWITEGAIDLVGSIVQGAPETGIGEGFFSALAPNLFKCLSQAEDRDVLQSGVTCLTLIIRKDCGQIVSWSDSEGRSGLDHVLAVVARLLENQDESGGLVIGDLIIHLLRRTGDAILSVLPEMLRAMVGRMNTAQTATFIQSLVVPFCFLIVNQRDTILSLLEATQIQGRSGLDIFIQTLCENVETFQGFWPTRISNLAISQLYISERPSLQQLTVKGDIIVTPGPKNVIMTRSRTKTTPVQFTSVPFPVKALKLLLHDLHSGGESATLNTQGEDLDVDSDDGDEDWTEEEKLNQGFKQDEFAFLSEMIGPKGVPFDSDDILEDNDDDDLKNDPVSQMDMKAHLISFFKECASRNTNNFSDVVGQLNAEEMVVVRRIISEQ